MPADGYLDAAKVTTVELWSGLSVPFRLRSILSLMLLSVEEAGKSWTHLVDGRLFRYKGIGSTKFPEFFESTIESRVSLLNGTSGLNVGFVRIEKHVDRQIDADFDLQKRFWRERSQWNRQNVLKGF